MTKRIRRPPSEIEKYPQTFFIFLALRLFFFTICFSQFLCYGIFMAFPLSLETTSVQLDHLQVFTVTENVSLLMSPSSSSSSSSSYSSSLTSSFQESWSVLMSLLNSCHEEKGGQTRRISVREFRQNLLPSPRKLKTKDLKS